MDHPFWNHPVEIFKYLKSKFGRNYSTNHQNVAPSSFPGQTDELPLPHAEVLAALADLEVESARHVGHVRLEVGVLEGAPYFAVAVVPERI